VINPQRLARSGAALLSPARPARYRESTAMFQKFIANESGATAIE